MSFSNQILCSFSFFLFSFSQQHMNIVLADCEEFRKVKAKGKAKPGQTEQLEKRLVSCRFSILISIFFLLTD